MFYKKTPFPWLFTLKKYIYTIDKQCLGYFYQVETMLPPNGKHASTHQKQCFHLSEAKQALTMTITKT